MNHPRTSRTFASLALATALAGLGATAASAMPVREFPQARTAHDFRGLTHVADAGSAARPAPALAAVVRPVHTLGDLRHGEAVGPVVN